MGIVIEKAGALTSVQDKGRYGFEQFGVSPSGPMDLESFQIANLLVGNDAGESALECTMIGPTLKLTRANVIAITGADMSPMLNNAPFPMNQAISVPEGAVLKLGVAKAGCRSYIAFHGGLDVPVVMGSRATGVQNKVGGFQGRKLAVGDNINFREPHAILDNMAARVTQHAIRARSGLGHENILRVILGPQDDFFTPEGIQTFLSQPYTVTKDFDRMGCRLEGSIIQHKTDGNIISDGMVTGAIQVPTTGQPIIMLAERQTVGGYTKIATVITADLPVIGQCRQGDVIRFQAIELSQAHQLLRESHTQLAALREKILTPVPVTPAILNPKVQNYRVTINGQPFAVSVERVR